MAASLGSLSNVNTAHLPERSRLERSVDQSLAETGIAPLYRDYALHIYRYCYRCLGTKEDAEDATSQVFMQALGNMHRLRDDNVRAWLYRIAHNVVVDMVRKRRQVYPIDEARQYPAVMPDIGAELERQELSSALEKALRSLSERDQQLVLLRLSGLSGEEIATVLDCSHAAVRVAHHRALDKLREILTAQGKIDV